MQDWRLWRTGAGQEDCGGLEQEECTLLALCPPLEDEGPGIGRGGRPI